MRLALASDDVGHPSWSSWRQHLAERGHELVEVGVGAEWPEVGAAVAAAVVDGSADLGIVACWTGTGVTIAANKVPGVRAALCADAETALGARRWNDANVCGLSLRGTSVEVGRAVLDAFLNGAVDEDERAAIERLEPGERSG